MKRTITTACVTGIQIMMLALLTFAFDLHQPAHADQIEPADTKVDTLRVTYVEPIGRLRYVELNDGSTWRLRPCRYEDGRHCYWDAGTRGNHIGHSFVNLRGAVLYTNKI